MDSMVLCLLFMQNLLFQGIPPPMADLGPITGSPVQFLIACGPFSTIDSLSYEPLDDLMNVVQREKPDVCIFVSSCDQIPFCFQGFVTCLFPGLIPNPNRFRGKKPSSLSFSVRSDVKPWSLVLECLFQSRLASIL
jgi:hypothetical protein